MLQGHQPAPHLDLVPGLQHPSTLRQHFVHQLRRLLYADCRPERVGFVLHEHWFDVHGLRGHPVVVRADLIRWPTHHLSLGHDGYRDYVSPHRHLGRGASPQRRPCVGYVRAHGHNHLYVRPHSRPVVLHRHVRGFRRQAPRHHDRPVERHRDNHLHHHGGRDPLRPRHQRRQLGREARLPVRRAWSAQHGLVLLLPARDRTPDF